MSSLSLQTENSLWFLPLCLLLGALGAYLLYSKNSPWSKQTNRFLAAFRFLTISLLAFFLLGPLIQQLVFNEIKPKLVIAIDDSESVISSRNGIDSAQIIALIQDIKSQLSEQDIEVLIKGQTEYYDQAEDIVFNNPSSDINSIIQSSYSDFENLNLAGVILLSDGIHNYGRSPQYLVSNIPTYAIGLGDTIPQIDLSIKSVNYNKVVYKGKRFPVQVDILNTGFVGESVSIQIMKGNTLVDEQTLVIQEDNEVNRVEFILDNEEVGTANYSVEIVQKENEASTLNNRRNLFIETVESDQKILIASRSPHPDVKALNELISSKEGTEVSIYIQGVSTDKPEGPFDLVILHQLPTAETNDWLNAQVENSNVWYITGTGDLETINEANSVIFYESYGRSDQVGANLNPSFDLFKLDPSLLDRLRDFSPINAPFGNFDINENGIIYLYQKLGNAQTNRPLLTIINDPERKEAVLSGSGIWKWKLQEFAQFDNSELFDEIFGKFIQFMTTSDDKRNFRLNTTQEQYFEGETVEFETEIYNQLFEQVFDYSIDLNISKGGEPSIEYNFANSETEPFEVDGLSSGIYNYTAQTRVGDQLETAQGTFSIQQMQLEDINLTANHELLKSIANNTGASFNLGSEYQELIDQIKSNDHRPIVNNSESLKQLIDNPLILILLLLLLSVEWFTRKYNGSY